MIVPVLDAGRFRLRPFAYADIDAVREASLVATTVVVELYYDCYGRV